MPRNRSEAERRERDEARINLRLSAEHKRRLSALAEESGFSLSDMVEALIDREWIEQEAFRATALNRPKQRDSGQSQIQHESRGAKGGT